MHFKKLELFGFKSFAEKTALNFEPGVTAIVGPNGCGKSNIADAIRWVLGEQSARLLRGSHMEDVIFNGTNERKPLSMAEVSLTLAGCAPVLPVEYDEVAVTRRIFRSGESQYFLNKTQVRLKDVQELFMGTGVGTRAYSLIEQGKIDLILSSKPEDRRFIFEEAAGITKFKSKKKEALRKLEQTEANLLRVSDIIKEVKRQINSIDRQAKKAQRYKERFEELKELELKLSGTEYEAIKRQLSEDSSHVESLRQDESERTSLLAKMGDNTNSLRIELEEVEEELGAVRNKQVEVDKEVDRYSSRISLDTERIDEFDRREQSVAEEIEELNLKITDSLKTIESLTVDISEADIYLRQKQDNLNTRQDKLDELQARIKLGRERLEKSKVEVIDITQNQTHIKNELIKLSANMANLNARLRRLRAEEISAQEEFDKLEGKLKASSAELKSASGAVEEGLRRQMELEEQSRQREDQRLKLLERLNSQKERLMAASSKLEFLEELRRKYEGFAAGVKELINLKNTGTSACQGIQGLVYDFMEVEPGYEAALESAFGDWLQAVIVNSRQEMKFLSDYLDKQNLGRVWFLPMEVLSSEDNMPLAGVASCAGLVGRASDFIRPQAQYSSIIKGLLEDTYVVESMEQALAITSSVPGAEKYRFVSLDGQMVCKRGLTWSGRRRTKPEEGLIGRQVLIRELRQEVKLLTGEVAAKETELKALEEQIKVISQDLARLRQELDEKRFVLSEKQTVHTRLESEYNKIKDELELVKLEAGEVEDELAQTSQHEERQKEELERIEASHNNIQTLMINAQKDINHMDVQREELLSQMGQFRVEISSGEEKLNRFLSSKDIYQKTLDEYNRSAGARARQLNEFKSAQDRLKTEISQAEERLEELSRQKNSIAESINLVLEKRAGINSLLKTQEQTRQQQQDKIEQLRRQMYQYQEKITEFSFKAQRIEERMQEAYKVDIQTVEMKVTDDFDKEQVRLKVDELKNNLEEFGSVNLAAVEEHQELTERYEFLTTQQKDLLEAKESLHKVIIKINRTTRKLFIETFTEIQATFRQFFRLLFGGGDADLILMDQDDILESGIEIMARPPGKKTQTITLLSGGEKSMTAIALLFSIFKVKPSPFCVLDEIDAALDEANVDRFSRVLTEFVKSSQFIIITHNKKTIGMADVMYGVTMAEFGVSKMVSVKLKKSKEADQEGEIDQEDKESRIQTEDQTVRVGDELGQLEKGQRVSGGQIPTGSPESDEIVEEEEIEEILGDGTAVPEEATVAADTANDNDMADGQNQGDQKTPTGN